MKDDAVFSAVEPAPLPPLFLPASGRGSVALDRRFVSFPSEDEAVEPSAAAAAASAAADYEEKMHVYKA